MDDDYTKMFDILPNELELLRLNVGKSSCVDFLKIVESQMSIECMNYKLKGI